MLTIGSDSFSFVTPYGYVTIDEMYDFVDKAGFSELETIKYATLHGAKMVHHEDEFGTLREGLSADLIVLNGDPLRNIHELKPENMETIMKEGDVVICGAL